MKINAGEIRVGNLIEYKNDLWLVLKTQHVKPGKGGAFAQVEMKSVGKNTKLNERFRSSETVEKASLEETDFNYLYDDEINYIFMDPKTFEQIEIKKDLIGEKGKLMTENLKVSVSFYNESPISVELPNQVKCKIETTSPTDVSTHQSYHLKLNWSKKQKLNLYRNLTSQHIWLVCLPTSEKITKLH